MAYCGKCGTQLSEGAKFCPKCGEEIIKNCGNELNEREKFCPKCGAQMSNKAKFCPKCGHHFEKYAVNETNSTVSNDILTSNPQNRNSGSNWILKGFFLVVIIGVYNAIMSAVKTHREEKRRRGEPTEKLKQTVDKNTEALKKHEKMLKADRKRLDALEQQNRITLRALMAMLSHEINGNSTDKLKKSVKEIQDFLIEK